METQPLRRAANMMLSEKQELVDLVAKYAGIIENKMTDRVSAAEKGVAWAAVSSEHNAISSTRRTAEQLKQVCCCNVYWPLAAQI